MERKNISVENKVKDQKEEQAVEQKEKSRGRRIYEEIMSWVKPMLLAVVLALFLDNFIIVNATVPTGSMENTIQVDTRLMGNRLAYIKRKPERGDIIIFKYPVNEKENYIKRVIGLPGETVEILGGHIYINGSPNALEEPYLKEEWVVRNDGLIFEVPESSYLVMGDNRNSSLDARYWAEEAVRTGLTTEWDEALEYSYVAEDKILGKAIFAYWPEFRSLTD